MEGQSQGRCELREKPGSAATMTDLCRALFLLPATSYLPLTPELTPAWNLSPTPPACVPACCASHG